MPELLCPLPLKTLLACTDESPASQGVLRAALDLGRACRAQVCLLYVMELLPFMEYGQPDALGFPPPLIQDYQEVRESALRLQLKKREEIAAQEGVQLQGRLQVGGPVYAEILAVAEELRPDLIIMGRRGMSGLERLLVGSVTARVIGHTGVMVLVVPRNAVLGFDRMLLAYDGSSASEAAAEVALKIAQQTGGQLNLITVCHEDLEPAKAKALARDLAEEARRRQVELITLTPHGRPERSIIEVAIHREPQLIILGSHGRTGLKRLLLGSVAERVIGQAPCPVLVVKQQK
jgi:nucleotide-binding universal stress UspA family protein|uniref:Universal stress protein n=1 Tax=Desulfobacca acetoxidans TaxID=60893 RepID=A0A7C5AM07_9BACT